MAGVDFHADYARTVDLILQATHLGIGSCRGTDEEQDRRNAGGDLGREPPPVLYDFACIHLIRAHLIRAALGRDWSSTTQSPLPDGADESRLATKTLVDRLDG